MAAFYRILFLFLLSFFLHEQVNAGTMTLEKARKHFSGTSAFRGSDYDSRMGHNAHEGKTFNALYNKYAGSILDYDQQLAGFTQSGSGPYEDDRPIKLSKHDFMCQSLFAAGLPVGADCRTRGPGRYVLA
ncbi:hypothetical protein BBBOND_0107920 [Babesia bigemina]|uniref:Uncharacterized protein n=1 Tax=Babesia bigemina TaxID=5866 RepID=A0A061D6D5_BABBI|nr:hypothetical protein BBBOND_0107920 [Babesia bigemina]CDR94494.1 hypothetical protein BBBOND_0107920 [Babesia bigemina]|eukprot:XP_012766680.1 hypothetical protein BBBOND_0107920 [Babesia bigemina]